MHAPHFYGWRAQLAEFVDSRRFQSGIVVLILLNAVTLGLETSASLAAAIGPVLRAIDAAILAVFVAELAARMLAHGWRFFRDPWGWFDLIVVGIALLPASGAFSVLRAFRVLRVLRLVSVVPSMRRVVGGLVAAIPGLTSIVGILGLVFYVSAVMATRLFGAAFPELFGTLGASTYSLFQVMTLEGWSAGIVRPVMEVYPWAWGFFIPYILIATFTVLNLFIAVIVNAMQSEYEAAHEAEAHAAHDERIAMIEEVRALRREVAALRGELAKP